MAREMAMATAIPPSRPAMAPETDRARRNHREPDPPARPRAMEMRMARRPVLGAQLVPRTATGTRLARRPEVAPRLVPPVTGMPRARPPEMGMAPPGPARVTQTA